MSTNPTISAGFKYIIPVSAAVEKDPDTGFEFIYAKITNPYIRDDKSAYAAYIDRKTEFYNPDDATDREEMKITKEIRDEVHEIWKILNPS